MRVAKRSRTSLFLCIGRGVLLVHAPRRYSRPLFHYPSRPFGSLIRVATQARIGDLVLIRHRGRDEFKCVAANVDVRDGLLNFWHVAVHAFATGASGGMVRVLLDSRSAGAVR